jgi:wyosine [tRNA(Phe)-imidazoG37] synthetase (radical SAM superfamily)
MNSRFAFGPVPSRRLGRSLGINNIPPKVCPYSCIYCQVGRTTDMAIERRSFYPVDDLCTDVREKVRQATAAGEHIDYLTFVPDGEPTLDANLGAEIARLTPLGIKTAVISNASLVSLADVREELAQADWVSLKVDAVRDEIWRRVNRPHRALKLPPILEGMTQFGRGFGGELVTETMLVRGVNDSPDHMREVADYLAQLSPARAYLAIPTRPPAEDWVHAPDEETINQAYQILSARSGRVEYLIGYEGDAFAWTGDVRADLLSITAVHPMREDAVLKLLARAGADWSVVQALIGQGELVEIPFQGRNFLQRRPKGIKHGSSQA